MKLADWSGYFGRRILHKPHSFAIQAILGRPFSSRAAIRCAVFYEPNRVCFSQVFPFLFFAEALRRAHGVEVRLFPIDRLPHLSRRTRAQIDVALVQIWFTYLSARAKNVFEKLLEANPSCRIAYLDPFAHNDLRAARHVSDYVTFYVKKALFRDRSLYLRAFRGDTNLTEHYSDLYGLPAEPVDWETPPAVLDKLRLGPGFFTGPTLLQPFLDDAPVAPQRARSLDVHARLETKGSEWYRLMREDALRRLEGAPALRTATGTGLSWGAFMREMGDAKLCLSPFGYGEVCWRDVEAFLTGSVLIKQDMSHLETGPELYLPGETYLPVRWDFADLRETIDAALADPDRCEAIAARGRALVRDYLAQERFVDDMAFLFR